MRNLFAVALVAGALGWGIFGGSAVELRPGSKMPAGLQVAVGEMPRQISQVTR